MKADPNSTHKPRAVDPVTFRAAATGIGQCFDQSVSTGMRRAQNVINEAKALQRTAAQGYPQPTLDEEGNWLPVDTLGVPSASPVKLRTAGK